MVMVIKQISRLFRSLKHYPQAMNNDSCQYFRFLGQNVQFQIFRIFYTYNAWYKYRFVFSCGLMILSDDYETEIWYFTI